MPTIVGWLVNKAVREETTTAGPFMGSTPPGVQRGLAVSRCGGSAT
jgi:hypothetical protein